MDKNNLDDLEFGFIEDTFNEFYKYSSSYIAKIFIYIIPIFYIYSIIDDINYTKNNPDTKKKLNKYRINIILYILYILFFIYLLYSDGARFFGEVILTLFYILSIFIYSFYIYNVYKKTSYNNYSFSKKVILYSLIFIIIYNFLTCYYRLYLPYIRSLKIIQQYREKK